MNVIYMLHDCDVYTRCMIVTYTLYAAKYMHHACDMYSHTVLMHVTDFSRICRSKAVEKNTKQVQTTSKTGILLENH